MTREQKIKILSARIEDNEKIFDRHLELANRSRNKILALQLRIKKIKSENET